MWPGCRAAIGSASSRASISGARRFTASTRSNSAGESEVISPACDSAAFATSTSTSTRCGDEALGPVGLGQVDGDRAPADLGRERLELLGPASG